MSTTESRRLRPRRVIPVALAALVWVTALLLPVGPALAGDPPAGAVNAPPPAIPAPVAERTRVALADVSDASHYKPMDLGEATRMGLITAMLDAQRIEIVPADEVANALKSLQLTAPLEDEQLQQVGQAVGAQIVVAARCIEARYDDYLHRAHAVLRVRILDTRSGLAVRTCQVRGESARNGHPLGERQLIEDAVSEAGYLAVEELKRNLVTVGTVGIALDDERVRVTLSSMEGVRAGTKLQVWENGRRIADLVVTETSELGCVAKVTGGSYKDLTPGMTVYVTEFATPESRVPTGGKDDGEKRSKHHSKWGTVAAIVLGVGLLYLAYREISRSRDGGGILASFRGIQDRAQIQSGQTVQLEVGFTNSRGQAVPDGTEVMFSLAAASSAQATTRQAAPFLGSIESPKTTGAGVATTTFVAGQAGQSVQIVAQIGKFRSSIVVDIVSGQASAITLRAEDATIAANGVSTTNIIASVTDGAGNAVVDGTMVTFAATQGTLTMTTVPTSGGEATTTLRSSQAAGPVTVTATANSVSSQPLVVTFVPGAPSQVILTASKTNLRAGDGQATISVQVLDLYGNPVPNTTSVTFGVAPASAGTFSQSTMTTVGGQANTVFTAGATPQLGTITCQAVDPTQTPPLPVQGSLEVNIAGTAPDEIQLLVNPATAPADGATTIRTRALVLQNGSPVADGTPVTFALTGNADGGASIRSRDLVTKDGQAIALVASTKAGVATLHVTAPGGTAAPQDASFEFTGLPANAIILAVEKNPIRIGQDNANGAAPQPGLAATTVTATLTDGRGQPVTDGTSLTFSADKGSISPGQALTTNGRATVTFTCLSTGVSKVTATSGTATASVDIRVLAGPAAAMTLTATPLAVRADGNSYATITCSVVDASGNFVDDGTRVVFSARDRAVDGTSPRVFVTPEGRTVNGVVTGVLVSKLADEVTGAPIETAAPPGSVYVSAIVPTVQDDPIPGPSTPVQNGIADVQFVSRFVSEIALGVNPLNVRGLDVVGNTSTATALVYDDAHNPVPDGTAVYFSISHGMIRGNAGQVGGVAQSYTANGVATATILTPGGLETGILNEPTFDGFVDLIVSVGGPPGSVPANGLQREFTDAMLYSGPAFSVTPGDPTAGPTTVAPAGGKVTLAPVGDSITYTITCLDENMNPVVDGTAIDLSSNKGFLESSTVRTVGGIALATLWSTRKSDDDPVAQGPGTVTVSIPRGYGQANLVFELPFTVVIP